MAVSMFVLHWLEFMMWNSVLVDITASGQNIDNIAIPFFITLTIETPAIGNSGFSSSPPSGCIPLEVEFTNNNPGLLLYEWDFGNGQISNDENPPVQTYTQAGNYAVQYAGYNNLDTLDNYRSPKFRSSILVTIGWENHGVGNY